jgi:glycine/D-amino acid oxidase-like deaminating enzyme
MHNTSTDLIVLGSGAAGMAAALAAAHRRLSVVVLEKSHLIGGTMAYSGGAGWLPLNPIMERIGAPDRREDVEAYIRAITGNFYDSEMVGAFLDNARDMVAEFEHETSAVRFQPFLAPDYHPDLEGAARAGRTLMPLPYDGRKLGDWLSRLRDAKAELTVFGGMQVDPVEALHLQNSWKRWISFKATAKLLTRYARDLISHRRGTRMIRGLALSARLLRSALDAGVTLSPGSRAVKLVVDNGTVTGVAYMQDDTEKTLLARAGVVLATGGFGANREMMAAAIPFADSHINILVEDNVGEGIAMAQALGADWGPENAANAIWAPGSSYRKHNGDQATYPHFAFDRCKPGSMIVGQDGRRFTNEAQSYHVLVGDMHRTGNVPAWLIGNRHFLRTYGMGMARPWPYPYRAFVKNGYLIEASSLEDLAGKIGVEPSALNESASRMNRFAASGIDEDFGKGGTTYERNLGHPGHLPNPCLGPIGEGPYFALSLFGTNAGTTRGLRTDRFARVLDLNGEIIGGLYAAGLDMHSPLRGFYPGAGTMIGPAMTFGFVAGRDAAERLGMTRAAAPL